MVRQAADGTVDADREGDLGTDGPVLRMLHSADWHLGHTLHGHGRESEHDAFLDWLVERCVDEEIDVLLVAGDVFDRSNPSAAAISQLFRFFAALRDRTADPRPVQVVAIAGNHDSPSRLTAPAALVEGLGVHLIGSVPRRADGTLDAERLVVPLRARATGEVVAQALAVPFLRPSDLRASDLAGAAEPARDATTADGARDGVAAIYAAARRVASPALPTVALGHAHLVNCDVSQLSERPVLLGGEEALPLSAFPSGVVYTALGHLHRAQRVGRRDHVRYPGSPIPLSLAESGYRHPVLRVDLYADPERPASVDERPIPRTVDLLRLGPGSPDEIERQLRALPERADDQRVEDLPFVEARVLLDEPLPGLKARLDKAVEDRAARLVKITRQNVGGDDRALGDDPALVRLEDLEPREVFARRWQSAHGGSPPDDLVRTFLDLVAEVDGGDGGTRTGGGAR